MSETYFQFPLCVLAMKKTPEDIIGDTISYSTVSAGLALLNKLDTDERREKCDEFNLSYKQSESYELAAHLGGKACNVTLGSARACVDRYHSIVTHVAAWERSYGKNPLVRMRTDSVGS